MHWNVYGEVDDFGGKFTGLLLLPLVSLMIYMHIVYRDDPSACAAGMALPRRRFAGINRMTLMRRNTTARRSWYLSGFPGRQVCGFLDSRSSAAGDTDSRRAEAIPIVK